MINIIDRINGNAGLGRYRIKLSFMAKMTYGVLKAQNKTKLKFLHQIFPTSFKLMGGEAWFNKQDKHVVDNFLIECIDKHNALSAAVNMEVDLEDQKSVNERLLESIQYQNKLLTEMLEILRKGSKEE